MFGFKAYMIYFAFAAGERQRKHKCDGFVNGKKDFLAASPFDGLSSPHLLPLSHSPWLRVYV